MDLDKPIRIAEALKDATVKLNTLEKYGHINDDPDVFMPDKLNVTRLGKLGWRDVRPSEVDRYFKMRKKKG
jgi:hypothetical protein